MASMNTFIIDPDATPKLWEPNTTKIWSWMKADWKEKVSPKEVADTQINRTKEKREITTYWKAKYVKAQGISEGQVTKHDLCVWIKRQWDKDGQKVKPVDHKVYEKKRERDF